MKRTVVVFALIFSALMMDAQEGKNFPTITGETLTDQQMTLPADTKGKITLVGMAFSKKSEDVLVTWYQPLYDKFVAKVGIFDKDYDVNVVFIPMYIGLKQTAYDPTKKELKESNRKDLFPYIMMYKGELEPYDEVLNMKDKNIPYFFLLDENGKIIYAASGTFTEEKLEKMEEHIPLKKK